MYFNRDILIYSLNGQFTVNGLESDFLLFDTYHCFPRQPHCIRSMCWTDSSSPNIFAFLFARRKNLVWNQRGKMFVWMAIAFVAVKHFLRLGLAAQKNSFLSFLHSNFADSCFRFLVRICMAYLCWRIMNDEPEWINDTRLLWQNRYSHAISPAMRYLYQIQIVYYVEDLFPITGACRIMPRDVKMLIHHLVTLFLLYLPGSSPT